MKRYHGFTSLLFCIVCCLCSCTALQQRGMAGAQYVSTIHPTFALGVKESFPLLSGGSGNAKLTDCGVLGGLSVDSWIATYGNREHGPLAVIAHAELPARWYWDAVSPHLFSVEAGHETIGEMGFDAWTYLDNDRRNAFCPPTHKENPDDGRWIVRCFARRTDFDRGKIVLEYRERLPEEIATITSMPFGYGDYLEKFAERARAAFVPMDATLLKAQITQSRATGIRWQYLNERFWGTVSPYSYYDKFR